MWLKEKFIFLSYILIINLKKNVYVCRLIFVIVFLGLIFGVFINSGSFLVIVYFGNNKGNEGIVCYNIN